MPSDESDGMKGGLVPNPFIKKRNLEWRLSPPRLKRKRQLDPDTPNKEPTTYEAKSNDTSETTSSTTQPSLPTSAAIESGAATISDHAAHFSNLLSQHILSPYPRNISHLSIAAHKCLFETSLNNPAAAHFVIHQHDHPIAGTHYDLRLQINGTSSASWAIMYGLPGDPNSKRPNRNATETRVHCLWNHLVETASTATGSLLVWDTGTYEVLPTRGQTARVGSDTSEDEEDGNGDDIGTGQDSGDGGAKGEGEMTQQQKFHAAFARRKIRLRLNGARLPRPYVVNLRLTKNEDVVGRSNATKSTSNPRPRRRRRGPGGAKTKPPNQIVDSTSDSNSDSEAEQEDGPGTPDPGAGETTASSGATQKEDEAALSPMERELRELEDDVVRKTNAYPGASNTIGSVHQRRWYLSLDKEASGFVRQRREGRKVWEEDKSIAPSRNSGDDDITRRTRFPFYVRGAECERSVITGRLGRDILRDEKVEGFVPRKGWRAVLN